MKKVTRSIHKLKPLDVMRKPKGKWGDGGGLWLMKDRQDAGYWALRYQLDGKNDEMGIGSIHTFSLAEARDRAKALRKKLKDGIDPLQDRKAAKARRKIEEAAATTFKEFALEYIERRRSAWTNPKHAAQWERSLVSYVFPIIGKLPIGAVDIDAVKAVLQQSTDGKQFWNAFPETASRVRSRIEKVIDAATVSGKRTGDNPARWAGYLENLFVSRAEAEKGNKVHFAAMPWQHVPDFVRKLRAREDIASLAGAGRKPRKFVQREPISVSVNEALSLVPIGKTKLYEAMKNGTIKSERKFGIRCIDYASLKKAFSFAQAS